jgi:hypothetical protein
MSTAPPTSKASLPPSTVISIAAQRLDPPPPPPPQSTPSPLFTQKKTNSSTPVHTLQRTDFSPSTKADP